MMMGIATFPAHEVRWLENRDEPILLNSFPLVGQQYFIQANASSPLVLNEPAWIVYESPLVYLNGYEKAEEFDDTRYCLSIPLQLVKQTKTEHWFIVQVFKVLTLKDCVALPIASPFPSKWKDSVMAAASQYHTGRAFSVAVFGPYIYMSHSSQSDVGQNGIFVRTGDNYVACMFDDWGGGDGLYIGKYTLEPTFVKWLQEESGIRYKVFVDNKLFLNLHEFEHYNSNGPYQWYLRQMQEVRSKIVSGHSVLVVHPNNQSTELSSPAVFVAWLKEEFTGGFEEHIKS